MHPIILNNETIDTLNRAIIKDKIILNQRIQELSQQTQELSQRTQDLVETTQLQAAVHLATTLVRLPVVLPEATTQLPAQVLLAAHTLLPAHQAAVRHPVLLARLVHQDLQAHQAALILAVAVADNFSKKTK